MRKLILEANPELTPPDSGKETEEQKAKRTAELKELESTLKMLYSFMD